MAVYIDAEKLSKWLDGHVGVSSQAIFVYMATGKKPATFDAPSDKSDRKRCIELLKVVPEWYARIDELAVLDRWRDQIVLIKQEYEGKITE